VCLAPAAIAGWRSGSREGDQRDRQRLAATLASRVIDLESSAVRLAGLGGEEVPRDDQIALGILEGCSGGELCQSSEPWPPPPLPSLAPSLWSSPGDGEEPPEGAVVGVEPPLDDEEPP
jgi:hypothetical protein